MNHLLRDRAPVSEDAWNEIEAEAHRTLKHFLTARRLVDFKGPLGWDTDSIPRGHTQKVGTPEGVRGRVRVPQAFVEYRAAFELDSETLAQLERDARDADLGPVQTAARHLALAEDGAIFAGNPDANLEGIVTATTHPRLPIADDYEQYPQIVARAVGMLQASGVGGPYAVALGPRCYTGVIETTEMGGYPVLEHLRLIAGGPVLWAPAVDGAVVLSTRGDDFELTIGQDVSLGYLGHHDEVLQLFLEESFTFQVLSPEAAVHLTYE
jgi:uncharacterized linocin/CFP29 family protein